MRKLELAHAEKGMRHSVNTPGGQLQYLQRRLVRDRIQGACTEKTHTGIVFGGEELT